MLDQPELCKHLIPVKGLGISPTKAWSMHWPSEPSFSVAEPVYSSPQPGLLREVSLAPENLERLLQEEDGWRQPKRQHEAFCGLWQKGI